MDEGTKVARQVAECGEGHFCCPDGHDLTAVVCDAVYQRAGRVMKALPAERAASQKRRIRAKCYECDPARWVIFQVAYEDCPRSDATGGRRA